MATFYIILGIICWLAALFFLFKKMILAPALSFLGLLLTSLAQNNNIPVIPINNTILIGWLCMTVVVMLAIIMQPASITVQSRGMGYILGGGLVGLSIGLLGFTFSASLSMLYGIMIVAVVAGIFFGYLLFTNTPQGAAVNFRSGNFYTYLLAKGFPTAITVMQIGVILVILVAKSTLH